ncbi:uncharacterized protein LOC125739146 isoform X2 [Brienomyrus brachyistius]|uniref:uncharacterized protein LOC125739146 isoform X2 n=1 Tax=Brienomyrus brachyistius TaxID=42636 RepID=UPI0020B216EC|nr:uncharacterized protein LOC125739146 isoform X2 [Brienomyrus brachyistius]
MTCHAVFTVALMLYIRENFHPSFVLAEAICPPPPLKANAKPFDESLRYPKGCVIEYGCSKGYVRKSGTSKISVCEEEDGKLVWKDRTTPLECKAKLNAKGDDPKLCPEIFLTTTTSSIPTSKVQFVEDPELCQEIFLTTTTSSISTSKVQFVEGIRILIGLALLSLLVLIVCIGVELKKQRNIQTAQEEEEPMSSVKAC